MPRRRRADSLRNAETYKDAEGNRAIILPAAFAAGLVIGPEDGGHARPLPDGRVVIAYDEATLAELALEVILHPGRVSEKMAAVVRALCSNTEWAEAEEMARLAPSFAPSPN